MKTSTKSPLQQARRCFLTSWAILAVDPSGEMKDLLNKVTEA